MIQTLPPAPRPVRKPVVAGALSLLVPGMGLLYVGAIAPALVFIGLWVVLQPLLALLLAAGAIEVGPWWYADRGITLVLRVIAAVVSFAWALRTQKKPLTVVPPGVYGLSLVGAVVLSVVFSSQLQHLVPMVELTAPAFGLRQGEYVQARKTAPSVGLVAVYLLDTADGGLQNPAAPTKRGAYVGRVAGFNESSVTIEGLDASIPTADYLGEALGVILSNTDGKVDMSRLGTKPQ